MSSPNAIFQPVSALVLWTLTVLLLIPIARFRAASKRQIGPEDFRYGESAQVPDPVRLPNRNFMNLLEVPVLFYAGALIAFLTQQADPMSLRLAWLYVGLRVAHSLVHLTYNNVVHRLTLFALSNIVILIFWLRLCLYLWT